MIKLNFFVKASSWSRRLQKIKSITKKVIKQKIDLKFNSNIDYYLNIILLNDKQMKKLNFQYRKVNKTTDVLTFVSQNRNHKSKKSKYCDIFISSEMVKLYSIKNSDINLAKNWIMVELFAVLNQKNLDIKNSPVPPENLSSLINHISSGKISGKIAKQVFEIMVTVTQIDIALFSVLSKFIKNSSNSFMSLKSRSVISGFIISIILLIGFLTPFPLNLFLSLSLNSKAS